MKPIGAIQFSQIHTLEQLADGNTAVPSLHPAVKLLSTLVYIGAVVSFGRYDLGGLLPMLMYPFLFMALSETPYRLLLKRFLIALPFAVFAGVSNVFLDRTPVLSLGGIAVSGGVLSFLVLLLKTYLTVMAVLLLVSTTTLASLSALLSRIRVPAVFLMQLSMTYRYLSVLLEEAGTMMTAYALRRRSGKGILLRNMGSFVGQLLLRSFQRAERVYCAMKLRGFSGAVVYTKPQKFRLRDGVALCAVCGGALLLRLFPVSEWFGQIVI